MQNDSNVGITVLTRSEFNKISENDKQSNVYLVCENKGNDYELLSLYLGNAKQTDITEIDESIVLNPGNPANNYRIDEKYRVRNKLYYYKQYIPTGENESTEYYRIVMWDGLRYLDMFSKENNVEIVTSLPASGKENYVYINIPDKSIYVYYQGEFVEIVSKDIFATTKDVDAMYNNILTLIHNKFGK